MKVVVVGGVLNEEMPGKVGGRRAINSGSVLVETLRFITAF